MSTHPLLGHGTPFLYVESIKIQGSYAAFLSSRRIFLFVLGRIFCETAWDESGCAFDRVCDRLTTWPEA
jgi:hypothetical protein